MSHDPDAPPPEVDEHWLPLEEIAIEYVAKARAYFAENARTPTTWQDSIDELPDHNQTMINAIDEVNPTLSMVIEELMQDGSDHAADAWTSLVNCIFDRAQAIWEVH